VICRHLGYTKQAYYKSKKQQNQKATHQMQVKEHVLSFRRSMPRLGTRKLHYLLKKNLPAHPIGRDALFKLLREEDLLVKRKRRFQKTTDSRHWMRKYPDLTAEVEVQRPGQLWVADITYLSLREGFCYLHLVSDAYSKKIIGYQVSKTLEACHSVEALKMALVQRRSKDPLIHHSDRGLQYCSSVYTGLLQQHHLQISMTQDGSPYDNAVAERINGILKDEFGLDEIFDDITQVQTEVKEAVAIYNKQRPHLANHYLTPEEMHHQNKLLPRKWKKKTTRTKKQPDGS
jgi:putative transposase